MLPGPDRPAGECVRNETLDAAKGVSAVLVVLAHAMAMQRLSGWLADMTHLATPLFFLLSGVFFNTCLRGRGWWLAWLDALL